MSDAPKRFTTAGAATGYRDACLPNEASAQRYRDALLQYFLRHVNNWEDAEDLTQEAFVRLARHKSPRAIENFEAFLFRIAANLLTDRYRRNQSHRTQQHIPASECPENQLGERPSEEYVYMEQQRLQTFLRALQELPPKCRTVFLLQRYEGLTYSAVGQKLGISVSAVEKHMMRALLHFNARLERP